MRSRRLIPAKSVFVITLAVVALTVIFIWLFGLGAHRSMIENSFWPAATLAAAFFLFVTIGLFLGIKLKDNLENRSIRHQKNRLSKEVAPDSDLPDVGEGFAGIVMGLLIWLLATLLFGVAIWIFEAVLWISILVFIAMLTRYFSGRYGSFSKNRQYVKMIFGEACLMVLDLQCFIRPGYLGF